MRSRICKGLLALMVAAFAGLASVPQALAGRNLWTPYGNNTGQTRGFTFDPFDSRTFYAAASGEPGDPRSELYRTTDGGQSWTFVHQGLGRFSLGVLEADPFRRGTLYAVNEQGTFFRSTDRAASWVQLSRIEAANRQPRQLLLLSRGAGRPPVFYVMGIDGWIVRSLDGGQSWTRIRTLSTDEYFEGVLAADPRDWRRLYVSDGREMLLSIDAGDSWNPLPPLPAEPGSLARVGIAAVAPTSPPALLAYRGDALYRSTNSGRAWQRIPMPGAHRVTIDVQPGRLWAGFGDGALRTSTDGGTSWRLEQRFEAIFDIRVQPGTGIPFAWVPAGLVRRQAAGRPWQKISTRGFLIFGEATFSRGPNPRVIFRGNGATVSVDGGRTYVPTGVPPQVDDYGYRVEVDPDRPAVRYSATGGGVYRSLDGGRTWTLRGQFLYPPGDPSGPVPRLVFVTGETLLGSTSCGLSHSTDGGATWRVIQPCRIDDSFTRRRISEILVSPLDPRTVFLRTTEGQGSSSTPDVEVLWRSRDGGATFEEVLFGPARLIFAPGDPRQAYLARQDGLWRSADGGETFIQVGPLGLGQGLQDLEIDPRSPATLYAAVTGSGGSGVLRSRDGGATWTAINNGLGRFLRLDVLDLVVDPVLPGQIYAYPRRGGSFEARFD